GDAGDGGAVGAGAPVDAEEGGAEVRAGRREAPHQYAGPFGAVTLPGDVEVAGGARGDRGLVGVDLFRGRDRHVIGPGVSIGVKGAGPEVAGAVGARADPCDGKAPVRADGDV